MKEQKSTENTKNKVGKFTMQVQLKVNCQPAKLAPNTVTQQVNDSTTTLREHREILLTTGESRVRSWRVIKVPCPL